MAVLLLVLKIIGLTLLGIVALALFILLLVLFVPVRYKAVFRQDEEFRAEAVISYLLHAVSFHIVKDSKTDVFIRILGIRFSPGKKKKDSEEKASKNCEDSAKADTLPDISDREDDRTDSSKDNDPEKKKSFNIKDIGKYLDFLNEENTKNTFRTCCKRLAKLLKIIAPKKFKAEVTYGLEDPSMTGKILALYNILYIYFDKHLILYPIYDESIVKSKGYMKGRVFMVSVLIQLILVVLDKDCRRFYKRVRNL